MSKVKIFLLIIIVLVLSLTAQALFGGWVSARLSTWPPLRQFNLFNPQAPIVITNKEVVRTSDTQDSIDAVNRAKSRLSTVVLLQNDRLIPAGTAVNVTADGWFVTAQAAFSVKGSTYFVVMNNGQTLPITTLYADLGSKLMFFKANVNSISVAPFADSEGVLPGQKIVALSGGLTSFTLSFLETWVSRTQNDNQQIFSSDHPARSFAIQNVGPLAAGEALVTLDGEIAGLWDGSAIVSANVIKAAVDLFFSNDNKINRPVLGFYYRSITRAESSALNIPQGAVITKPDPATAAIVENSPADVAGLQEGDYILQVKGTKIEENTPLEEILEKIKPGDLTAFTLVRNKQTLIVNLTAAETKTQ